MTKRWKRRPFLAILAVIVGLVLSGIELAGPEWHLVHGDSVHYRGWRIPIPYWFCVTNATSEPKLWNLPLGAFKWHGPCAYISFLARRSGEPLAPADYRRFAEDAARRQGYRLTSERKIPVDGTFAECFESVSTEDNKTHQIVCPIRGSILAATYIGSPNYFPDFYSMLQGMSRDRTAGVGHKVPPSR